MKASLLLLALTIAGGVAALAATITASGSGARRRQPMAVH